MCKIILNLVCAFYLGNQEGIRIKNVNIREQLCWQALYVFLHDGMKYLCLLQLPTHAVLYSLLIV